MIRDPAAIGALGPQWNALLERSPQAGNPMLTHEWFRAWWEAFGEGKDLLILLAKSSGRLIGIVPLMRLRVSYHGLPIRLVSLITNEHTNRADFILAERPDECVALVLDFLRRQAAPWDMAELNFLPAESLTVPAIRQQAGAFGFAAAIRPSYRSPVITLSETWEHFYGSLDGHFRRNMKNREKRLATLGAIEYEEDPSALNSFLEEMFVIGDRSWKGEENTAIASTPPFRRFYTLLAELTHPRGWLSLHLLRVGGQPVAFHYSLRSNGTLYLLKTEYDTAYHTYSPGHQIQKRVLQGCYRHGIREFDFLGPDMAWKREWADQVKPHVRLLLFHSGLMSRLLAFLELHAKPWLKSSPISRRFRSGAPAPSPDARNSDATQDTVESRQALP